MRGKKGGNGLRGLIGLSTPILLLSPFTGLSGKPSFRQNASIAHQRLFWLGLCMRNLPFFVRAGLLKMAGGRILAILGYCPGKVGFGGIREPAKRKQRNCVQGRAVVRSGAVQGARSPCILRRPSYGEFPKGPGVIPQKTRQSWDGKRKYDFKIFIF